MIYLVLSKNGDDFGHITKFKSEVLGYLTINGIDVNMETVSNRIDELCEMAKLGGDSNLDFILELETVTLDNEKEFNVFKEGLEVVSTHGFETYLAYEFNNKKDELPKETTNDDPYYLFVTLELGRCYGVLDSDTEYDNLWADALILREEFINSKYNVDSKSEYDCISEFCQNYSRDMNIKKKGEVERILIDMWTKIGMDIPDNNEDIIEYCFKDICETADKDNWGDGDVVIAFRRWVENVDMMHI